PYSWLDKQRVAALLKLPGVFCPLGSPLGRFLRISMEWPVLAFACRPPGAGLFDVPAGEVAGSLKELPCAGPTGGKRLSNLRWQRCWDGWPRSIGVTNSWSITTWGSSTRWLSLLVGIVNENS